MKGNVKEGHVVLDYYIGATRVKVCDDYCLPPAKEYRIKINSEAYRGWVLVLTPPESVLQRVQGDAESAL